MDSNPTPKNNEKPTIKDLKQRCREKIKGLRSTRTKVQGSNVRCCTQMGRSNNTLSRRQFLTKSFLLNSQKEEDIIKFIPEILYIFMESRASIDAISEPSDGYDMHILLIAELLNIHINEYSLYDKLKENLKNIIGTYPLKHNDNELFDKFAEALYSFLNDYLKDYSGFINKSTTEKMNFAKTFVIFLNIFQVAPYWVINIFELSRESYNVDLSFLRPIIEKFKGNSTEKLYSLI